MKVNHFPMGNMVCGLSPPAPAKPKPSKTCASLTALATALGCLDLAKAQLIQEHMEDEDE